MKTNTMRIVFVTLITTFVIAAGTNAFAGRGKGGCGGYGNHDGKGGCGHGQAYANLTEEQKTQIDAERKAFFEATQDDRQELHAKRMALRAEIAQTEPDVKKAEGLQKEISELQGRLGQKRLAHVMAIRKISPDAARGFGMGHKGYHGTGRGMGYGPGAGDCPYR